MKNDSGLEIVVKDGLYIHDEYTKEANKIADYVRDKLHLSFDNVEFRLVDNDEFAESIALYTDPLPSWHTGQEFVFMHERMSSQQMHLYEMVGHTYTRKTDNKPFTLVYINRNNSKGDVLSVIAHVYGHLHMNKNNWLCSRTKADLDVYERYRERYRKLEEKVGSDAVESMYDTAQTLTGLIDIYPDSRPKSEDSYYSTDKSVPRTTVYDIYKFVIENARLNPWEKELLDMVYNIRKNDRGILRTKIMHEGFATFVEEKYVLNKCVEDMQKRKGIKVKLEEAEDEISKLKLAEELKSVEKDMSMGFSMENKILKIADVLNGPQFPYAFGFRLFRDIEERWDKGRHGPRYERLSAYEKKSYDSGDIKGLEKVLEVAKHKTDWDFMFSHADTDFINGYMDTIKQSYRTMIKTLSREQLEALTHKIFGGPLDEESEEEVIDLLSDALTENLIGTRDPNKLRLKLLLQTERSTPNLYIPKGVVSRTNSLFINQDVNFIDKYIDLNEIVDDDGDKVGGTEAERAEYLKAIKGNMLTLDNEQSHTAMKRLANLWGGEVVLRTIDNEGNRILLSTTGTEIRRLEESNKKTQSLLDKFGIDSL